jgi:hypothetical protein
VSHQTTTDDEFCDDLKRIASWTDSSNRAKIETSSGSWHQFFLGKRYTKQEIERLQSTYCLKLPRLFQQFLEVVGCGQFFAIPYKRGIPFTRRTGIDLKEIGLICQIMPKISNESPHKLFERYIPLGVDFNRQKAIILDQSGDGFVFFREHLPDDWCSIQCDVHQDHVLNLRE